MNKVLFVSFILLSNLSFSQVQFGFTAGVNSASQKVSYNRSMRISTNPPFTFEVTPVRTYHAGVSLNVIISKRLDLRSSLLYFGKGQYERLTRTSTAVSGFDFTDHINYLDIPISLVIDLGKKERNGLFLSTGFYFARAVSGKSDFFNYDIFYASKPEVSIVSYVNKWDPYTLYVKSIDFGFRNSIGFRYAGFNVEIFNELGLVNNIPHINNADPILLSSVSNKNTRKNFLWSLSVTYFINK